jgi:natural resistance-associated macrophage protein
VEDESLNDSTNQPQNPIKGDEENVDLRPEDPSDGYMKLDRISFRWATLWKFSGPGWLMSIAFLDPGNIAGDLQAGTQAGYKLEWLLFWSTVIGLFFQCLAARVGVVTQRNMARVARETLSYPMRIFLWLMMEIAIIGADIQEVIGSSIALNVLFGLPLWAGALITIFDSFLFLFIHYFGVRKLEYFFAFLITSMAVCFAINFFASEPDWGKAVVGTIVPIIPAGTLNYAIGVVGAVIMPHNLYLHSALVLSRDIDAKNKNKVNEANYYNVIESAFSLGVSFFINWCVIGTFASFENTPEAPTLGLRNAHLALEKALGPASRYVWAFGLLAAGQSSTMTGTYAGQFVMEGFMDIKLPVWKRVSLTRLIAILPALSVSFINGYFDIIDNWLNILQSVQLPFAMIPLLLFVTNEGIMGQFAIGRKTTIFAIFMAMVLITLNIIDFFPGGEPWEYYVIMTAAVVSYLLVCLVIATRKPKSIRLEDAPKLTEGEAKLQVKLDDRGDEVFKSFISEESAR